MRLDCNKHPLVWRIVDDCGLAWGGRGIALPMNNIKSIGNHRRQRRWRKI